MDAVDARIAFEGSQRLDSKDRAAGAGDGENEGLACGDWGSFRPIRRAVRDGRKGHRERLSRILRTH